MQTCSASRRRCGQIPVWSTGSPLTRAISLSTRSSSELGFGVLALPSGRKRTRLEAWFKTVVGAIECLPWDAAVSLRWARLVVGLKKAGTTLPALDTMIAATALEHNLTVVTRNVR